MKIFTGTEKIKFKMLRIRKMQQNIQFSFVIN